MAQAAIATMILTASILAAPVLAITQPGSMFDDAATQQAAPGVATCTGNATLRGQLPIGQLIGARVPDERQGPIGWGHDIVPGPGHREITIVRPLGAEHRGVSIPFGLIKIESNRLAPPGADAARLQALPDL